MNKNDMSAAGFYFTSPDDMVRCAFCEVHVGGGSLEMTLKGNIGA
jgi:hypothetical protein